MYVKTLESTSTAVKEPTKVFKGVFSITRMFDNATPVGASLTLVSMSENDFVTDKSPKSVQVTEAVYGPGAVSKFSMAPGLTTSVLPATVNALETAEKVNESPANRKAYLDDELDTTAISSSGWREYVSADVQT